VLNVKRVLIVEPGFKSSRERVLKEIKNLQDIELHVCWGMNFYGPQWAEKYTSGSFEFSYTKNNLSEKIKEYEIKNGFSFDGVCTHLDTSVHFVNEICHERSLPVISAQRGKLLRNKFQVREALKAAGVMKQFEFWRATSRQDLEKLSSELTYPVIVKPTEMMASLAVFKVCSPEELIEFGSKALASDFEGENLRGAYGDIESAVVIEEFLEGPEISAEAVVHNGHIRVIGFTEKQTSTGRFWDELGHDFPARLSLDIQNEVTSLVIESLVALKIQNSIVHAEVKLTPKGPAIVEINSRLCGDLIYSLIEQSAGVSTGELMVHTCLGNVEEAMKIENKIMAASQRIGIRFLTLPHSVFIQEAPSLDKEEYSKYEFSSFVKSGEIIEKPEDVYGIRICSVFGPSDNLDQALEGIAYKARPIFKFEEMNASEKLAVVEANLEDLSLLDSIERRCWDASQAASRETIEKRLKNSSTWTLFGIDMKSKQVVASICALKCSQREFPSDSDWASYATQASGDKAETGAIDLLSIVSLSSLPDSPKGAGGALMNAMVFGARDKNLSLVRYGIRVPHFSEYASKMGIEEYLLCLKEGRLREPMYAIAMKTGGSCVAAVENYFDDPASMNYGIIIEHKL